MSSEANTGAPERSFWTAQRGLKSWLFTVDHKRLGVMYLAATALFLMVGGAAALALRTELLTPEGDLVSALTYNKLFTVHGAVMVFLVIIPAIPGAMGNFVLPLMLGAKDVAFPKLNLLSFWVYSLGACFFLYTLFAGGLDTGWTFYTPYSSSSGTSVVSATLGAFILGFSSILTGLNFIVTAHKLRAPGQGWFRMPLFVWAIYATALLQVLATPVLGITVLLLAFERLYHIGIFDPHFGGDPVLFQHFFWFYSHPAVYIMILPAMGIISDVVSVHSRKPIFGYRLIAFSSLAIAIISFIVWGHHMFTSGQSELAMFIFSFLTFFVAIPSAIKEFNWVATIWRGSISLEAPMLYALSFLIIFAIGGLTGVILGTLSLDIHLHDTYFVVAHFHYVMMGSTAMAFFAGVHHWWPKMFGVMYSRFWSTVGAVTIFVGFNWTFLPQFTMGSLGMPRRYAYYVPEFQGYHQQSTIGAMILASGIAIMVGYLVASLFSGKKAGSDNPWGGASLEWETATPPIHENFDHQPVVEHDPYDFTKVIEQAKKGSPA